MLYNLNVILTYSFVFLSPLFVFLSRCFFSFSYCRPYLMKPNESAAVRSVAASCRWRAGGGGSLALPAGTSQEGGAQPWQHNIHQSVKAHIFCPFSLIFFHSGLQWRRPTQLFIQLKTSDAENAANLAFCLQRSAKNGFFHTIGRGQKTWILLVHWQD